MTPPKRPKRKFIPENLIIDSWKKIEPFFKNLLERKIKSLTDLEKWMRDRSELEAVLEEDMAWRYIKMNINTADKELAKRFHFWINEISPNSAPYSHKLNLKLIGSDFLQELDKEKYKIYLRGVKQHIQIFREENIPLFTKMEKKQQEYGSIFAKMNIEIDMFSKLHNTQLNTQPNTTQHKHYTKTQLKQNQTPHQIIHQNFNNAIECKQKTRTTNETQ